VQQRGKGLAPEEETQAGLTGESEGFLVVPIRQVVEVLAHRFRRGHRCDAQCLAHPDFPVPGSDGFKVALTGG
jgi:hypothetical protein